MSNNKCRTWTDGRELGLEQSFACAPERLFDAWTQPEILSKWFAPHPWSVPEAQCDLQIGGASQLIMRGPDRSSNSPMSASISKSSPAGASS